MSDDRPLPVPAPASDERPLVPFDERPVGISHDEKPVGGGASLSHDERPLPGMSAEDKPLPLRDTSNDPFGAEEAGACAAPPLRGGAWSVAALNFNSKRVPFSPFDEEADGKLGSVYTRLTETLVARGDWDRRGAMRNKATGEQKLPPSFSLLLGTAQGKGITWGRLGYGIWPPPLVNYCRGFDMLTRKGKMAATLEVAKEDCGGAWPAGMPEALTSGACLRGDDAWELAPASFIFHPSKGDANPREALREAYAASAASVGADAPEKNRWILKPSEGAKGEGIFIETSLEAIEEHLTKQEERAAEGDAVSSWVVQKYIHNPLLLRDGSRKFDMRCWVLVDADYGIHLYRHGVLRVASAAYDASNIANRFSHLTNHCIATEHAEYGKFEPTNEKFYPSFDEELAERFPELAEAACGVGLFGGSSAPDATRGSVMETVVLPQIRRHVVQSLLAARERLQSDGEYYRPFQLFGYDFLLDDELRVWLCEINASPAVADELLPGLVDALIRTAIDPICAPNDEMLATGDRDAYAAAAAAVGSGERFECICAAAKPPSDEQ